MNDRIVVAEPDDSLRWLLAYALRRAGFRVAEAADGYAALTETRFTRPELVVLSVSLPGRSGPEVAETLAADPLTAFIPVLVLGSPPQLGALPDLTRRYHALVRPVTSLAFAATVQGIVRDPPYTVPEPRRDPLPVTWDTPATGLAADQT